MMPVANDPIAAVEPTRVARPRRVEVIVVSGDDEFLIELGPLLGEGFRTRPVDSPAAIAAAVAEQAEGGDSPPSMIMLDGDKLSDPRAAVAQIETAHPHLPIIVIAASRDESYWGAALARAAIVDVIARYDLNSDQFKNALSRAETRARSAPQTPPPGQQAPPAKNNSKLLIGAAVALAIGLGGWFMLHKSDSGAGGAKTAAQLSADNSAQSAAAKPQSALELLSAARIAFRDQKLLPHADGDAKGDSALELYAQVLVQDPKNDEAIDGLQRLFIVIKSRIQADLLANRLDEAQRLLAAFKPSGVEPDGVRDLDASITAARPKYYAARAQELISANDFNAADQMLTLLAPLDRNAATELRHMMDTRKADQQTVAQLTTLSASVKAAIDSGNLLEPANDNARTRLQAMRQIGRTQPITLAAQRDLQAALINRSAEQSTKEQFDPAAKLLAAAAEIAATPEVAEAKRQLQSEIDTVNQRAAAAAAAAKKAAEAAQTAAATQSAAAASTAPAPTPYMAARPTTPLRVVYPSNAADDKVQGFVIVEFMLQADGKPTSPTIAEASPVHVFDAAAIDAVMGARYDTSKFTDKTPRRARVRLTFRPS